MANAETALEALILAAKHFRGCARRIGGDPAEAYLNYGAHMEMLAEWVECHEEVEGDTPQEILDYIHDGWIFYGDGE